MEKGCFGSYELYTLASDTLCVRVTTLGAIMTSLCYRGRELLLTLPTPEAYLATDSYAGAVVGRYANRIAGAHFAIDGREYELTPNEGRNQLHGGPRGFNTRVWRAETHTVVGAESVRFTLLSPDGENGYPGNLHASVTYTVTGDALRLDFEGESDADTIYAPTTHVYFHLGAAETIEDTRLSMTAERYLPVDAELLPAGAFVPAEGDFDFRGGRELTADYDHCFLFGSERRCAACAGGVELTLETDYPAVQLYTGSALGAPFRPRQGFALEPEFPPDSPNRPDFPSPLLRAGERFHKSMQYKFRELP